MIIQKDDYLRWIQAQGVGAKDKVASSPDSYVSYLNSVSELLEEDISPRNLSSEADVLRIARQLRGRRADGTVQNYKSAMRQYVAMIRSATTNDNLFAVPESQSDTASLLEQTSLISPSATEHNLYSSYREVLLEHLLAGEIMKHLWLRGNIRIEVLKPQVDDAGYDLVLEANGVVRHVQLKSSHAGSTTGDVRLSLHLAKKPSGCVIWLWFNPLTLELGPFFWFGNAPGLRLPEIAGFKVAKHTKGNAQGFKLERPNVRVIPKSRFESVSSIEDLILRLFGPPNEDS